MHQNQWKENIYERSEGARTPVAIGRHLTALRRIGPGTAVERFRSCFQCWWLWVLVFSGRLRTSAGTSGIRAGLSQHVDGKQGLGIGGSWGSRVLVRGKIGSYKVNPATPPLSSLPYTAGQTT